MYIYDYTAYVIIHWQVIHSHFVSRDTASIPKCVISIEYYYYIILLYVDQMKINGLRVYKVSDNKPKFMTVNSANEFNEFDDLITAKFIIK